MAGLSLEALRRSAPGIARRAWPYAVTLLALFAIRHALVSEVGGYGVALRIGLLRGVIQDAAVALLPIVLASALRGLLGVPYLLSWGVGTLALCTLTLANLEYVRHFGSTLEPWVVQHHLRDLWTIRELVEATLQSTLIVSSVVAGVAVTAFAYLRWRDRTALTLPERLRCLRVAAVALGAAWLLTSGARALAPAYLFGGSAISEHVLVSLYADTESQEPNDVEREETNRAITEAHRTGLGSVLESARGKDLPNVAALFDRYRESGARVEASRATASLTAAGVSSAAETTLELRRRFGLPESGPIHVIVLFLETVRAYEVLHPQIGRPLMWELYSVLDQHGVLFSSTYTSSLAVGLTVRAQLSTLCSMLPNFHGAATYIAHPTLRLSCLAGVSAEQGYRTLWISGTPKHFHNKHVFESVHGMQEFYDHDYFAQFPFEPPYDSACDIPDRPFLERSAELLELQQKEGKPLFASMLTLSTHPPYTRVRGTDLPKPVERAVDEQTGEGKPKYSAYLERLRYLDRGLGTFFERLFASKLGDSTLVVVLGDHGSRLRPPFPHSEAQQVEMAARVPMAFVSKHLRKPERIERPVHQVDIAPTIAAIAGFAQPPEWLGHNLFAGGGSPWLFAEPGTLHYREGERACYTEQESQALRCYRTERDPLFAADLPPVEPDPEQTRYYEQLSRAVHRAITLNAIPNAR